MADLDKLKDEHHDFDGIQEYDNDLPRWWLAIFYLTIVWAGWYVFHYHLGPGVLGTARLKAEEQAAVAAQAKGAKGPLSEEQLRALSRVDAAVTAGASIFAAKCAICHKADGTGQIGPNLRDRFWIHGNRMEQIVDVIANGRVDKGMTAYKGLLPPDDIHAVTAYLVSLARQGEKPGKPIDPAREKEMPIDY